MMSGPETSCSGFFASCPKVFHDHRNQRQTNYSKNDRFEIVSDKFEIPEEISEKGQTHHPNYTSYHVVPQKFSLSHAADPGYKWGKGPYDGYKPGDNDGFGTVFFVKFVGLIDVLWIDNGLSIKFPFKYLQPNIFTYRIIGSIPSYGGNDQKNQYKTQVQLCHLSGVILHPRTKGSGSEQQGVPGQKRHHHDSCFYKYDQK